MQRCTTLPRADRTAARERGLGFALVVPATGFRLPGRRRRHGEPRRPSCASRYREGLSPRRRGWLCSSFLHHGRRSSALAARRSPPLLSSRGRPMPRMSWTRQNSWLGVLLLLLPAFSPDHVTELRHAAPSPVVLNLAPRQLLQLGQHLQGEKPSVATCKPLPEPKLPRCSREEELKRGNLHRRTSPASATAAAGTVWRLRDSLA